MEAMCRSFTRKDASSALMPASSHERNSRAPRNGPPPMALMRKLPNTSIPWVPATGASSTPSAGEGASPAAGASAPARVGESAGTGAGPAAGSCAAGRVGVGAAAPAGESAAIWADDGVAARSGESEADASSLRAALPAGCAASPGVVLTGAPRRRSSRRAPMRCPRRRWRVLSAGSVPDAGEYR